MSYEKSLVKARQATQAIFLVCGLAISSWAPMVPLVKERLGLNDANLGLLLLMLGAGAIVTMPVGGYFSHRFGTRIVILISGLTCAVLLPLLLIMPNPALMGAALFIFGAGVGTIDVAMNAHGVHVQNSYGKPIMSALHGLFSVGGLCGSLGLGVLIKSGLEPITAAVFISGLLLLILFRTYGLLFTREKEQAASDEKPDETASPGAKKIPWINASVIFLGLACFAVFLSEGAMLDWSALFLQEKRKVEAGLVGMGYAAFSVAMAVMRLMGDRLVEKLEGKTVVIAGGLIAASGVFLAVFGPWVSTTLLGFVLLGIGAANIVPVFFSAAGRIKGVPASLAIPVITTIGYAGQLAGPALLGFIAYQFSLDYALLFVGFLLVIVALGYALKK